LSIEPLIALTAFGGFGLIYVVIIGLNSKQLSINSNRIARESTNVIKSLKEGLGGIRDVLIIAHRLTTLKNCTQIVELGEGGIKCVSNYQDIVNQSAIAMQKNKDS